MQNKKIKSFLGIILCTLLINTYNLVYTKVYANPKTNDCIKIDVNTKDFSKDKYSILLKINDKIYKINSGDKEQFVKDLGQLHIGYKETSSASALDFSKIDSSSKNIFLNGSQYNSNIVPIKITEDLFIKELFSIQLEKYHGNKLNLKFKGMLFEPNSFKFTVTANNSPTQVLDLQLTRKTIKNYVSGFNKLDRDKLNKELEDNFLNIQLENSLPKFRYLLVEIALICAILFMIWRIFEPQLSVSLTLMLCTLIFIVINLVLMVML